MSKTPSDNGRPRVAGRADPASRTVTLYCVNGLYDGSSNWLDKILPGFTDKTGLRVNYVEDHSRAIVQRLKDEGSATRADVLITLPPFIHMAVQYGLLESYRPTAFASITLRDRDPHWRYCALVGNYPDLIYNRQVLAAHPVSYTDFLAPVFAGKIQYSKPGWSGAGTSLLLQVFHAFGGKTAGFEYLKALQSNCCAPSEHTSGLAKMVNDGKLLCANGDLQTNFPQLAENPNIKILFPTAPDGKKYAFEYPYYIALPKYAPDKANARKLIDYLLSEGPQSCISQFAQGLPARSDINIDDQNLRQLTALLNGVEIWEPDWATIAQTLEDDIADYERIVLGGEAP